MVWLALDAMGGDFAPREIVKGGLLALKENSQIKIILVGPEAELGAELKKHGRPQERISLVGAEEIIEMHESPIVAVRRKKNSSINVGLELVKNGQAQAFVSAGNTGAVVAASLFTLGRIEGIERPAILLLMPTGHGPRLLIDVGANVDSRPKHLLQFAQMASLFAEKVFHIKNPRVGLLSIGEEAEKGNELVMETQPLLKNSGLNFVGNVESKDILTGIADVFVCDGFVGNMILKFSEGVGSAVLEIIRDEVKKNWLSRIFMGLAAPFLAPIYFGFKKKIDFEEYGGAPLLGVDGLVFISHGRSKAKAIKNALLKAEEAVENNLLKVIKESVRN